MPAAEPPSDEKGVLLECPLDACTTTAAQLNAGSEGLRCRVPNIKEDLPASYDHERNSVSCTVPLAAAGQSCSVVDAEGRMLCSSCGPHSDSPVAKSIAEPGAKDGSIIMALSFVDRLLALWIILAMVLGVLLGYYVPSIKESLERVYIDNVSLPVALGLWGMMWPVLSKVKYEVLGSFLKRRDSWVQIAWSLGINWIVGPWLMTALAWATLPDVPGYRNGIIIVGIARCIAMVLIWNQLARGDPEYCALLVAINSIMQMVLFAPYAMLLLKVVSHQYGEDSDVTFDFWTVARSVLIFLGAPLVAGIITRYSLIYAFGEKWYNDKFLKWFGPMALISLIYTIIILFALQGHQVIENIGDVFRIAVPMSLYFAIMWVSTFFLFNYLGYPYTITVTQCFTASSNNFELAIAIAAGTFGSSSPEALAATIGPLIEVPALLALVYLALWLKDKVKWATGAVPGATPTTSISLATPSASACAAK